MPKKELLPIRNFKPAVICATALSLLLILIRHPVEELAVTAAVLYVTLWFSKEVIERLVMYFLDRLIRYSELVVQKLGAGDSAVDGDGQPPAADFSVKAILVVTVALWLFASIGAGFILGSLAIIGAGLTPLPAYLTLIAGALFLAGGIGWFFLLLLMLLALIAVDQLAESVSPRFNQLHAITREANFSLRNKTLTRPSRATA